MSKLTTHFNLTVLGRLDDGVNQLTLAMSQVASQFGDVISGEYLEKKALPGRKELFHIRYNTSRYECEHINSPIYPDNLAKSLCQADAIVLLTGLYEGVTAAQRSVLQYARENQVEQVIVLQLYSSNQKSEVDGDLQELALLETQDVCAGIGFSLDKVHIFSGDLAIQAIDIATKIFSILDAHFRPRLYRINTDAEMYIEKVYHVSDKSLKNASVAYGFLKSGTILPGMNLRVIGFQDQAPIVRIRSMEIFGQEVSRCEAGRSVAVLLERTPKNFLESGQILVTDNNLSWEQKHEIDTTIWVPAESGKDPISFISTYQQFEMFLNMGKITARWLNLSPQVIENKVEARILLEKPVASVGNMAALILIGNNVMAVGVVKTKGN